MNVQLCCKNLGARLETLHVQWTVRRGGEVLANMFVTSLQSDLNCRQRGKGFILIDVCYISVTENSSSLLQVPCKSKR
jgi:hypothetical protein